MFEIINTAHAGVITDAKPLSEVGISVLNFLLSLVGIVGIIALVIAGVMYFTSFGNDKSMQVAKKYATNAVIGIVFALSGMILLNMIGNFFKK